MKPEISGFIVFYFRRNSMDQSIYPVMSKELAKQRTELAPEIQAAFKAFSSAVFAEGALPKKTKQLIAVAVAHVTQCPYCIKIGRAHVCTHVTNEPLVCRLLLEK